MATREKPWELSDWGVVEAYWKDRARELEGIKGVAARFGHHNASKFGRELYDERMKAWELEGITEDVPVMPLPTDATAQTARKKSAATQRKRRGRQSTILTPLNIEDEGVLGA